jgi:hypothetical protein
MIATYMTELTENISTPSGIEDLPYIGLEELGDKG